MPNKKTKKEKQTKRFDLRLTKQGRNNIEKLAKILKIKSKSEVVRRAVALTLKRIEEESNAQEN